jgi:uncharacterized NAD-dependent epimerase/dehydratase family protein
VRKPSAAILSGGLLGTDYAKTANDLVRTCERYEVLAVIDGRHAGADAGAVVMGRPSGLPVFATVAEMASAGVRPDVCIVSGVPFGSPLPDVIRADMLDAVRRGMGVINGLHVRIAEDPEIAAAAASAGVTIQDVRRPRKDLRYYTGEVLRRPTPPRVPVLGTDMCLGKLTTARLLTREARARGVRAETLWTGHCGFLQGGDYGVFFDATPNDFCVGELEGEVLRCIDEADPELIFIEGQSALRSPAGPCGAEFFLSLGARGVVLQHAPRRRWFDGLEGVAAIPPVETEIELLRLYGVEVYAVTLNQSGMTADEAEAERASLEGRLGGIPVALPLVDLSRVVDTVLDRAARPLTP